MHPLRCQRKPTAAQSLLGLGLVGFVSCCPPNSWAAHVNVIELDNEIISPVTQQYITEAITRAETDGAACLVLLLDTPGGLLESTRGIVKRIMNARVPVVVYVAPAGSRAGSAGVFITYAAHVSAMAPSTNIGAAHPVGAGGEGGPVKRLIKRVKRSVGEPDTKHRAKDDQSVEEHEEIIEEEHDPMSEKIVNDTVAWITTIAKTRGRNEEWAKKAVTDSFSVTETDAVKNGIVDLIAADLPDLLAKLDGRRVELAGNPVELSTKSVEIVRIPMSSVQRFLAVITNPNVAYLLMLLGTLGLIFEFTHPGIGFPGIAGLICLLLALYAFQALPVSYAAVALILVGLALLIAEIKIVSHGLLGIGGVIALTLGSLMLFESPDPQLQVSLGVALSAAASVAIIILFILRHALKAQGHRITTGIQGLVGEAGVASTDLAPAGQIFVHGEIWSAKSLRPVQQGAKVRVLQVNGMELLVEPHEDALRPPASAAAHPRRARRGPEKRS